MNEKNTSGSKEEDLSVDSGGSDDISDASTTCDTNDKDITIVD